MSIDSGVIRALIAFSSSFYGEIYIGESAQTLFRLPRSGGLSGLGRLELRGIRSLSYSPGILGLANPSPECETEAESKRMRICPWKVRAIAILRRSPL